jgi:hypothetical protein
MRFVQAVMTWVEFTIAYATAMLSVYLLDTKRRRVSKGSETVTSSIQVERYFDEVDSDTENVSTGSGCLDFWASHKGRFPALYQLAISLLSAPASSAPIERVFSHGGIMMRPHRASLGDTTLAQLIFLKCNRRR